MDKTLQEVKSICFSKYGYDLSDSTVKQLTSFRKISHKKVLCEIEPVLEFCQKWKDCEEKGYKRIGELRQEILEKYHRSVPIQCIYKLNPQTVKLSKKILYIKDWERILEYFSEDFLQRRKRTNLAKYGTENPAQSEKVQSKLKATKTQKGETIPTLAKFFNRDYATIKRILEELDIKPCLRTRSNQKFYNSLVKETIQKFLNEHEDMRKFLYLQTCMKKYGKENISQIDEIKAKKKQTTLSHYGVENFSQLESTRKKLSERAIRTNKSRMTKGKMTRQKVIEDFEKEHDCISLTHLNNLYNFGYDRAGRFSEIIHKLGLEYYTFKSSLFICNKDIDKILNYREVCSEKQTSFFEREIISYIQTMYQGGIISNNRYIIPPKELDIYIPEKRLAIEFDGLYWHSELFIEKNYHLDKTLDCEDKEIRLMHIFEDEWIFKKPICKSLLASALGVYEHRYYARKCSVRRIDSQTTRKFMDENHIQGYIKASDNYGLFYGDTLIQAVSLGKSRFKSNETELLRMATVLNSQVIGGFSKLLKHAMDDLNISVLYSYVDRRLFNGKGYEAVGFRQESTSSPSYFYFKGLKRENRLRYQKHKLSEMFENFDPKLTEKENMLRNNYHIIYDCGTLKMRLQK